MISELPAILSLIKKNVSIQFWVYCPSATFLFEEGENCPKCKVNFDKLYSDAVQNKTFFKFTFSNVDFIGVLDGVGEVRNSFAGLISTMIENMTSSSAMWGKTEYLKRILLGDVSVSQIQKFVTKFSIPDCPCYALAIHSAKRSEAISQILEESFTNGLDTALTMEDGTTVVVKYIDTPEQDYSSASDHAGFIAENIYEELGVKATVGVGTVVSGIYDIAVSYQQAATAVRMCNIFQSKGQVHSYKEYILVKMLEDIPENKLKDYMYLLMGEEVKDIFEDDDLINTAEEFLQNSLNVSETSRNLYMHRNTLMYRLDKIERATGLNIRKFSDAVSFRVMTILHKLIIKNKE